MKKGLLVLLGLCLASAAGSQDRTEQIDEDQLAKITRYKYEDSLNLPDGIAMAHLLESLNYYANGGEREAALGMVEFGMGLTGAEAEEVVDYLSEQYVSYERDDHRMLKQIACPKDRPRASGDEIYAVMEAIEDARLGLQTQYVAAIKAGLGQENAARFDLWLNSGKLSMTAIRFKLKEAAEFNYPDPVIRHRRAKENLDGACQNLEGIQ